PQHRHPPIPGFRGPPPAASSLHGYGLQLPLVQACVGSHQALQTPVAPPSAVVVSQKASPQRSDAGGITPSGTQVWPSARSPVPWSEQNPPERTGFVGRQPCPAGQVPDAVTSQRCPVRQ